ncbi:MAG: vitamin K epoxide reductase family protein [Bdellovibrionales bacterium]|nr:vitamin K epoxide reductase family protein [Bdellovibrionales bacterium]
MKHNDDEARFIEDPGAMMAMHPKMHRWVHPVVMLLGVWLVTSWTILRYDDSAMMWSDVISGVLIFSIAAFALRVERLAWVSYLNALVGVWLLLSPLLFWAPNAATYTSNSLIGAFVIAFSFVIPMSMRMPGPDIPPGWSYNPSTWIQRAPIIVLGLIGYFLSRPMAAYQLGYVDQVWEPFFSGVRGNGTETILTSEVSRAWPISDAGLGAATYLIEVLSTFMGDERRWRTMPWMVAIFGIAVIPLGITSIVLVIMQPVMVGTWCTLCLIAAAAMLLMIPLALDEIVAMIQFLNRSRKQGKSVLRVFIRGGSLPDATTSPRVDRKPSWKPQAMLWGVTGPWNLWVSAALGVWLMAIPALFGIGKQSAAADNAHLVGALVTTVAVVAMAEVGRLFRWANVVLGAWLLTGSWLLGDASALAHSMIALTGALLMSLSFPLGQIRDNYGTYTPWVFWKSRGVGESTDGERRRAA